MCRQPSLAEAVLLALCILGACNVQADVAKRAPSGFLGMRGKKQDGIELVFEDLEKRAPSMGFQGVRGKKTNDLVIFDEYEKTAPGMGYLGGRDKKEQQYLEDPGYYEKRVPSMGFQSVRGKKDSLTDEYKRAPSRGFQGMRGKKDEEPSSYKSEAERITIENNAMLLPRPEENNEEEAYASEWEDIWGEGFEKRAPSGFLGMRGKKGPKSGFLGMRGKKAPSGFMGMRGKKAPSGFMGMRGKKADDMDLDAFLESLEEEELREEADAQLKRLEMIDGEAAAATDRTMRQKRYRGPTSQKKAPSGFLGMRGKKWYSRLEALGPELSNTL